MTPAAASDFVGKRILLLSPQPWGDLWISKHHYASELARVGADVFFLGPPEPNVETSISSVVGHDRLHRIRHRLPCPMAVRFHARSVFDFFVRRHAGRLTRAVEAGFGPIDVVWSFEPNLYSDLSWFRAPIRIYHPVDPITERYQLRPAEHADLMLFVSEKIRASFDDVAPGVPRLVLGHGLGRPFLEAAEQAARRSRVPRSRPRVGYVGNLLRRDIGRDLLLSLIDRFPNADFVFWGPCGESNLGDAAPDALAFVAELRRRSNVTLAGVRSPDVLAHEIQDVDLFLLYYLLVPGSDRSNSHKILEYLSTGKPVVSCRIDEYRDQRELISMPFDDRDDDQLAELLAAALHSHAAEDAERAAKRRRFAAGQSYASHLDRIAVALRSRNEISSG